LTFAKITMTKLTLREVNCIKNIFAEIDTFTTRFDKNHIV
ncbi:hypothetical protein ECDEC6A_4871, partial [Escherichia coli DEC6A]